MRLKVLGNYVPVGAWTSSVVSPRLDGPSVLSVFLEVPTRHSVSHPKSLRLESRRLGS